MHKTIAFTLAVLATLHAAEGFMPVFAGSGLVTRAIVLSRASHLSPRRMAAKPPYTLRTAQCVNVKMSQTFTESETWYEMFTCYVFVYIFFNIVIFVGHVHFRVCCAWTHDNIISHARALFLSHTQERYWHPRAPQGRSVLLSRWSGCQVCPHCWWSQQPGSVLRDQQGVCVCALCKIPCTIYFFMCRAAHSPLHAL